MNSRFTPSGHNTVAPYLLVEEAGKTLAFLTAVFGAVELRRMTAADGSIKHVEVRIGDSIVMIGERASKSLPASIHVYVADTDQTYAKALGLGATSVSEPRDLPYGDRSAGVRDTQGNLWWLGTHRVPSND
jgi:uncharacterized glyoxalase superfamily protein PhnB